MEEWKTYRLGEVCEVLDYMRRPLSAMQRKNMQGEYRYYGAQSVIDYVNDYIFDGEYMILAEDGENLKSRNEDIAQIVTGKFWLNNHAHIVKSNGKAELSILCSLLNRMDISGYITGSAQPKLNQANMLNIKLSLPPLPLQRRISSLLSSLDAKIETNRRINARLEEMAQALFRSWFIDFTPFKQQEFVEDEFGRRPKGWEVKSLSEIAKYLNGLAMQKFPPRDEADKLPVLKIKELGQDCCASDCDYCSRADIGDNYIIDNGDVIFSWSGTLMVKIWTGGKCGLNQHLFKVTSASYPKWFYFLWTKHHNDSFIRIAKDKAVTMGHIKRGELDKAKVFVPDSETLQAANDLINPIIDKYISGQLESSRLAALRDTLLPKLMSGEIIPEEITASRATRFL